MIGVAKRGAKQMIQRKKERKKETAQGGVQQVEKNNY